MIISNETSYLYSMNGTPLNNICLEGDMIDIGFGREITAKDLSNARRKRPQFNLHIQCPFRILRPNRTKVVASYDTYIKPDIQSCEFRTQFEYLINQWIQNSGCLYVKNVKLDQTGDLAITLSNADLIEVFIDTTTDAECWRFFEIGSDIGHLVAYGNRIVLE